MPDTRPKDTLQQTDPAAVRQLRRWQLSAVGRWRRLRVRADDFLFAAVQVTSGGRLCPPTRYSAPIFTGSVHGSANGVESPLHPVATGRNTARKVAAPSDASRRRTLPDGGAASNIKRRESLDFRGFFEGKAGAGQLFDLGIGDGDRACSTRGCDFGSRWREG